MPAFTFEKIPAPPRADATPPASSKHRGKIARLIDRLTEIRLQSYNVRDRRRPKGSAKADTR